MRYWLTTHWPIRIDDNPYEEESGIWIVDGREKAGEKISKDDLAMVYESRTGKTEVRTMPNGKIEKVPCRDGRGGIILYGRIKQSLYALSDSKPISYDDGTTRWWRWNTSIEILSRSGNVPMKEVSLSLGYKANYNFHGFGHLHSGLREIAKQQFEDLKRKFHMARPLKLPASGFPAGRKTGGTGESGIHRTLKEFVAANPCEVFKEPDLVTLGVEYSIPTGDRADIVLEDRYSRVVAVEIEPAVEENDICGILQAIKYRYMLECITERTHGDSRAVLIAHSISESARERCKSYKVETIEVDRETVNRWINNKGD
jgi:hypothetical protein